MLIPESFSHESKNGTRSYIYKRIKPPEYSESNTFTTLGASVSHEWKSQHYTSNKIYPTDYSHCNVVGSAKFNSRYEYPMYTVVTTEALDYASLVACLYSTISGQKARAPIHIGASQVSSRAALDPKMRFFLREDAIADSVSACNNGLLAKIENQSIHLGGLIAELGETVGYLYSYAKDFGNFAKAIYSGRWNKALKVFRISKSKWNARNKRIDQSAAGRWLEWSFAIKPLVSDVTDLAHLYSNPLAALKELSFVQTATVKFHGTAKTHLRLDTNTYADAVNTSYTGKVRTSCTFTVHDHEIVAKKALGLEAMAPAFWEGIPFSWLIDYVVNIGEFMAGLTATRGLAFVHGYRSFKVMQRSSFKYTKLPQMYTDFTYAGNFKYEGYFRYKLTKFPVPSLRYVLPEITGNQVSYVAALVSLLIPYKRRL